MNIITIECSCCGNKEHIAYSAANVNGAVSKGWNSFGGVLYCPKCSSTWEERNGERRKLSGTQNTVKLMDELYQRINPALIIERCWCCNKHVKIQWNVQEDGYEAFCPYCGNKLMLCSECQRRNGESFCDWNRKTEDCRISR